MADQQEDPRSLLSLCRRLIAVRRLHIKGREGTYAQLPSADDHWVYQVGDVVVAANFSETSGELRGQPGLLLSSSFGARQDEPVGETLHLAGLEAVVVQRLP